MSLTFNASEIMMPREQLYTQSIFDYFKEHDLIERDTSLDYDNRIKFYVHKDIKDIIHSKITEPNKTPTELQTVGDYKKNLTINDITMNTKWWDCISGLVAGTIDKVERDSPTHNASGLANFEMMLYDSMITVVLVKTGVDSYSNGKYTVVVTDILSDNLPACNLFIMYPQSSKDEMNHIIEENISALTNTNIPYSIIQKNLADAIVHLSSIDFNAEIVENPDNRFINRVELKSKGD